MASDILRRRAELQAKLDEYPGCEFGVALQILIVMPLGITPAVQVPNNCTKLGFYSLTSPYMRAVGFSGQTIATSWTMEPSSEKEARFTAGTYTAVQMTFNVDEIDNCYIKDKTNNQYLWKGKNVT